MSWHNVPLNGREGEDPLTSFNFTENYDAFGQPRKQMEVACPRGWKALTDTTTEPFLVTRSLTKYATPVNPSIYIQDRIANDTRYEIINDGMSTVLELKDVPNGDGALTLIGQEVHFYDGSAFVGRDYGEIGDHGALARTEQLIMTESILHNALSKW